MNLNKCCRCGCFYSSEGNVCPNCQPKDFNEIAKLKNYFDVSFLKKHFSPLNIRS